MEIEHELVTLKSEVKQRDIVANKLLDALLKKYSLSNNALKRQADEYWGYLNPQAPEDPFSQGH